MDLMIMDIKDVPGESLVKGFEKKIEILSFSHGVSMQVTGDVSNKERTSGKPNIQDFSITKYMDVASPVLNQKCCEGKAVGDVKLTIGRNENGEMLPLIVYTLSDAIVSSMSVGGGGGDKPVENLSWNFSKIKWEYTAQKPDAGKEGTSAGVWDLKTNTAK